MIRAGEEVRGVPRWAMAAVTAMGAGYAPLAPGTAGTLVGVALYLPAFWAGSLGWAVAACELGVTLLLAALALPRVLRVTGIKDPQFVVLDEVAGMLAALCFAPPSLVGLAASFLLFRTFDILKPYPVGRLERLPGAWGVMADDLAAGVFSGVAVFLLRRLIP